MKNNIFNGIIQRVFGKFLAIAFLCGIFAAASYAQTNKLYYQSNHAYYGTVTVYPAYFEINTNDSVIKTYRNSCKPASSNGVAGLYCTFGQFRNGKLTHSGWAYFFQNGYVYLNWTYEFMPYQKNINTGWYLFLPK